MTADQRQLPSLVIAAALFLLVAAFAWAFAAAQYAHAEQGWRSDGVADVDMEDWRHGVRRRLERDSLAHFVVNAFEQVPHAPAVVNYSRKNRFWLIGIVVALEVGVVGLGLWMRSLERDWARPRKRRKRNRFVAPN